jgi:hypothetical protein
MREAAPIYYLEGETTKGPYSPDDIIGMLDEGEIEAETLSCIEGMRGWRSIPETLVWSHGCLLRDVRAEVADLVGRMCDLEIALAPARSELVGIIDRRGDSYVSDSMGTILEVNMSLLRKHRGYRAGHDGWSGSTADQCPALELLCMRKQLFPRDWKAAWALAGGQIQNDRMVALRNDPIWTSISDFGFPFSPFSFDWMMTTETVFAEEADVFGIKWKRRTTMEFAAIPEFELVGI